METITKDKFLVVGKPDITELEQNAVLDVMRSGWLGNGPIARKFEAEFCKAVGNNVPNDVIAVNSCTTGLILALRAEGIGRFDEVITTPLTFAATVNAILAVGATPVFVDVDSTGCIDPQKIVRAITPSTRAIIPVHLHGFPCRMGDIMGIAGEHDLKVIEDAAHAFGGFVPRGNIALGTIGHYGIFSFYPTKNITTADGGMVVVNDGDKSDYIRTMASQGLSSGAWARYGSGPIKDYRVETEGMKGLMPDLNAAIGLAQLQRWPEMKANRSKVFNVYERAFGNKPEGHSQHIYAIRSKKRAKLRTSLHEKGIGTGIHYNALHTEPAFQVYAKGFRFPMAEQIGKETMSLPLSSTMTEEDAFRVVETVYELKGDE